MKLSAYHQPLREKLLPGDVQAYVDGTSASRIAQARGMSLNTVLRRLREAQVEISGFHFCRRLHLRKTTKRQTVLSRRCHRELVFDCAGTT